jgi:hypothetical protein
VWQGSAGVETVGDGDALVSEGLGLLDAVGAGLGLLDAVAVAVGLLDSVAVALGLLDVVAVALTRGLALGLALIADGEGLAEFTTAVPGVLDCARIA